MRCPHTHFRRGKRVRIKLKDGSVLIRRFVTRLDAAIRVADVETGHRFEEIPTKRLLNVSIWKQGRAA